jgi:hypothetical protein
VVGAEQTPKVEIRVETAAPKHEAVEQQHDEGDEDSDVGKTGQRVVGHLLLAKGVYENRLEPISHLFRIPGEPRVGNADRHLPHTPVCGP